MAAPAAYVFVSSIMAYEPTPLMPWTEDLPVSGDPPTTYGGFKAYAETEIRRRFEATGFPGSIARPAAIYGPDNNIHDMETAMFLRLRRGLPVLLPHGGLVTVSYGHVDDLCAQLIAMARCAGRRWPARWSTRPGRRSPPRATCSRWPISSAPRPTCGWCPTSALATAQGEVRPAAVEPSVQRPAPRHPLDRQGRPARAAGRARIRHRAPGRPTSGSVRRRSPTPRTNCSTRCGRRVTTSRPKRPRSTCCDGVRRRGHRAGRAPSVRRACRSSRHETQRWDAARRARRRAGADPTPAAAPASSDPRSASADASDDDGADHGLRSCWRGDSTTRPSQRPDGVRELPCSGSTRTCAAAAPLLELFTGHHQDPEGGPPTADADLVRRLEAWLGDRAGGGSRSSSAGDVRRVQPADARRAVDRQVAGCSASSRTACSPPRAAARSPPCGAYAPRATRHRRCCGRARRHRARQPVLRHGVRRRPRAHRRRRHRRHAALARRAARPRPTAVDAGGRARRRPRRQRAAAGDRRRSCGTGTASTGRPPACPIPLLERGFAWLRCTCTPPARSVDRARRPRAGQRAAGRARRRRCHRLGVRPRRRCRRGLGLPGPDPRPQARRARRSGRPASRPPSASSSTRRPGMPGRSTTTSRAPVSTSPRSTSSGARRDRTLTCSRSEWPCTCASSRVPSSSPRRSPRADPQR